MNTPHASLTLGEHLQVRRLGFGATRLTGRPNGAVGIEIARRSVEPGVTFVDTADSYDFGDNETLLAEVLYLLSLRPRDS